MKPAPKGKAIKSKLPRLLPIGSWYLDKRTGRTWLKVSQRRGRSWALAAYAALLIASASVAQAQEHPRVNVLALTLVGESGYSEDDHLAILEVFRNRAKDQGVSLVRTAAMYSSVWRKREMPQRVLDAIHRHPGRHQTTINRIRGFLSGSTKSKCRARVWHFGMPTGIDLERAKRAGWKEIDCGKTKNKFYGR